MNDAIEVKICFWKFGVNECLTNKRMSALDSFIRFPFVDAVSKSFSQRL
jgi:hypothetical protein